MRFYLPAVVIALAATGILPQAAVAARGVTHRHPPVAHARLAHARLAHAGLAHAHLAHARLAHASRWTGETGTASYYGPAFDGRRSADGSRFNQYALTAAHPWLPFGTKVKVNLPATGRSVVVTITDRMHKPGRIVDLSTAAARRLGMTHRGLAEVRLLPA